MVRTLIFVCLLVLPITASSDGGNRWFRDWWDNVYQQRIEKQQYQQIQSEELTKCDTKLRWYDEMTQRHPKSDYYRDKLEDWQGKCARR